MQPAAPLRLPGHLSGLTRGGSRHIDRLIHLSGSPVMIGAALRPDGGVRVHARAPDVNLARLGVARARFWAGVDDKISPFLERYIDDPLIGKSVRDAPWLRPYRRAMPFDVLLSAICEQLVDDERSQGIKRAVLRAHGRPAFGLTDYPSAKTIAGLAPSQLERCGLSASRALTLVAAAKLVASGRVDLHDPERYLEGWQRLRSVRGVGAWTVSTLALHGQGHWDALPAGDFAYRSAVATLLPGGRRSLCDERDVVELLEPYRPWRGLAGWHLLRTVRLAGGPVDR